MHGAHSRWQLEGGWPWMANNAHGNATQTHACRSVGQSAMATPIRIIKLLLHVGLWWRHAHVICPATAMSLVVNFSFPLYLSSIYFRQWRIQKF